MLTIKQIKDYALRNDLRIEHNSNQFEIPKRTEHEIGIELSPLVWYWFKGTQWEKDGKTAEETEVISSHIYSQRTGKRVRGWRRLVNAIDKIEQSFRFFGIPAIDKLSPRYKQRIKSVESTGSGFTVYFAPGYYVVPSLRTQDFETTKGLEQEADFDSLDEIRDFISLNVWYFSPEKRQTREEQIEEIWEEVQAAKEDNPTPEQAPTFKDYLKPYNLPQGEVNKITSIDLIEVEASLCVNGWSDNAILITTSWGTPLTYQFRKSRISGLLWEIRNENGSFFIAQSDDDSYYTVDQVNIHIFDIVAALYLVGVNLWTPDGPSEDPSDKTIEGTLGDLLDAIEEAFADPKEHHNFKDDPNVPETSPEELEKAKTNKRKVFTVDEVPGSKRTSPKNYPFALIGRYDIERRVETVKGWDFSVAVDNWHYYEKLSRGVGAYPLLQGETLEDRINKGKDFIQRNPDPEQYRADERERTIQDVRKKSEKFEVLAWSSSRDLAEKRVSEFSNFYKDIRVVKTRRIK